MNVAIIYDRVTKWGGAERVLLSLHKIWPNAPLYTAVYDRARAGWADVFTVQPSFLQKIPLAKHIHEFLPWATPLAFEAFDLNAYDVVLSVTSAEAKYVITRPGTVHICYCLTPTRYLWSGYTQYQDYPGLGIVSPVVRFFHRLMAPRLRQWDLVGSSRPDYYLAISNRVASRIKTYYRRDTAKVIYPPVDTHMFSREKKTKPLQTPYFLTVSRLVGYKRVDILVDAFNYLKWPLVIIGQGRDAARLRRKAGNSITFIPRVSDADLVSWYQHCEAFVYAAEEDFGIAAVEALAAGKPVIAYGNSALNEIVSPGKTGELFGEQTSQSLVVALKRFKSRWYDTSLCKKSADRFSEARFRQEMKNTVTGIYNTI